MPGFIGGCRREGLKKDHRPLTIIHGLILLLLLLLLLLHDLHVSLVTIFGRFGNDVGNMCLINLDLGIA